MTYYSPPKKMRHKGKKVEVEREFMPLSKSPREGRKWKPRDLGIKPHSYEGTEKLYPGLEQPNPLVDLIDKYATARPGRKGR